MKINPVEMILPFRKITGMSAMLLPFRENGEVDWDGFEAHLRRTVEAGLIPAVNMDTGYANLIDEGVKTAVLQRTQSILAGKQFVAGAYVGDKPGDPFNHNAYTQQIDQIQQFGGTPIIFQSFGLTNQQPGAIVQAYEGLGKLCDQFIAFELGQMFAPFGQIYDLDTYAGLMAIPQCMGAKHSSLKRELEWQRLALRDVMRPDFMVLTGNDLAIDMVMYGSDYLLGISTFAPDLFAKRDAFWAAGDPAFYELNDLLQYVGFFAFRPPVPAYKHSAAQFLKLRGWLDCDDTHPGSPSRPDSDRDVLRDMVNRIQKF